MFADQGTVQRDVARWAICGLLGSLLMLAGCSKTRQTDTSALDQAGMWSASVRELKSLNVSNAEVAELAKAHDGGLSDSSCVELIKLARARQKPFVGGQSIADLLAAGAADSTVVALAGLNQLGLWTGEARALRLAGISDKVILAVAQRRSEGLPALSGETLGNLKNAGADEAVIVDMVQKGLSDRQAASYIAQRQGAAGGHGFIYQGRSRRRH